MHVSYVHLRGLIFACAAVALSVPCFARAVDDPAANVKFSSMLNKSGQLTPDNVTYLIDHRGELKAWADICMRSLPLSSDIGEIPNPKLLRVISMMAEGDAAEAERLSNKLLTVPAEVAKEVRSRRGEILTKAFLASGDPVMELAGIQAAAKQYPSLLVRAVETGVVEQVYAAVEELGRNKVSAGLSALRTIAENSSNEELQAIAKLAIANIKGDAPPESMVSGDAVATARAFVAHVQTSPEWFTEDELQITLNPVLKSARKMDEKWKDFVANGRDTAEGKQELAKRNQLAETLAQALVRPGESFIVRGARCRVILDGKAATTLYRDMLGRWRLQRNP